MVWPEVEDCTTTQSRRCGSLLSCTLVKWIFFCKRVSSLSHQAPTVWEYLLLVLYKFPSLRVPSPLRSLVSHSPTLYDYRCIYMYLPLFLVSNTNFWDSDNLVHSVLLATFVSYSWQQFVVKEKPLEHGCCWLFYSPGKVILCGLIFSEIQEERANMAVSPVEIWRIWKGLWCPHGLL